MFPGGKKRPVAWNGLTLQKKSVFSRPSKRTVEFKIFINYKKKGERNKKIFLQKWFTDLLYYGKKISFHTSYKQN